ncbi:MAG: zinc ribbon domain-containing protein [Thermomicrobiales bacterium]|nr:zinc ribbon domain-containing protein [Thermomicrobiales bacterium]
MPTYDYLCDSCGHRFDLRQSFSDDPIRDGPVCGSSVRRVVYPAGVIFKGSGWYINDSRNGAPSTSPSKSSSESSSTTSTTTSTTTSEAKEAVKSSTDS